MPYTLYHGDCLDLLEHLPDSSVDLLLTDPPYGISYQSAWRTDKSQWFPKIKNDSAPFTHFIPHLSRVIKPNGSGCVFTRWDVQQIFIDEMEKHGLSVRNVLIWDKAVHGMGDLKRAFGSRYESIIFFSGKDFRFQGKRPTDILRHQRVNPNKLVHPTQKPTALLTELINNLCPVDGVVLDPFAGSGSTGVAALASGRRFVGSELDDTYYNLAMDNLATCSISE